jgi:hypothetical protein
MAVFWYVTCAEVYHISEVLASAFIIALMIEAASTFEVSVNFG